MSRGLGFWQRSIVATVERHGAFYLRDLAAGATRSQYVALHRAAHQLMRAGKIGLARVKTSNRCGIEAASLLVISPNKPEQAAGLNVAFGANGTKLTNNYTTTRAIAKTLNVSKSTVSRDMARSDTNPVRDDSVSNEPESTLTELGPTS